MTGIVGPNGCGKSNIVEGLRWVMGESNARQMRGSEMDDIIFAGTDQRPARNLAEITLRLDNSNRSAPSEFNDDDELEITRKIERGKGSSFYVNAKPARAKDVQLLFADSATGARSSGSSRRDGSAPSSVQSRLTAAPFLRKPPTFAAFTQGGMRPSCGFAARKQILNVLTMSSPAWPNSGIRFANRPGRRPATGPSPTGSARPRRSFCWRAGTPPSRRANRPTKTYGHRRRSPRSEHRPPPPARRCAPNAPPRCPTFARPRWPVPPNISGLRCRVTKLTVKKRVSVTPSNASPASSSRCATTLPARQAFLAMPKAPSNACRARRRPAGAA